MYHHKNDTRRKLWLLFGVLFCCSSTSSSWILLPSPPQQTHRSLTTTSTIQQQQLSYTADWNQNHYRRRKSIPSLYTLPSQLQRHQRIKNHSWKPTTLGIIGRTSFLLPVVVLFSTSSSDDIIGNTTKNSDSDNGIDVSFDPRLYKVRLSRATGIDWGTDLSFSFVYVRGIDPTGEAAISGVVSINDQLCEVTPITTNESTNENEIENSSKMQPLNLIGAPFDYVMETFATLDKTVKELDFVFFRGSRDALKSICTGGSVRTGDGSEMITVTVVENKGSSNEMIRQLKAPVGVNVRELLVDNNINVYQSITRWTNCKGKQLCGTCIVNVPTGGRSTNRKSMDESSTLRENPDTYRLSCVSFAYGDITVETFPPINAAQWTR